MKKTYPEYYKKFTCIADKCTDTCCAGWDVVIDGESLEKYKNLEGLTGEKIRSLITVDEDGDSIFKSKNGRCPFLLESGLCEMYKEIGHENLCLTCRKFPRFTNAFGSRIETGISLSCPEAARLIFESDEPVGFVTEETEGALIPSDFDAELYFTLLDARKTAIDILQKRKFSIERRICAFIAYSQAVQECINRDCLSEIKKLDTDGFFKEKYDFSPARAKRAFKKYQSDFSSLEYINPAFGEKLTNAASVDIQSFAAPDYEYEHLLVYFVFRYFITAAYDYELLSKAKFAALSFIMIKRLYNLYDAHSKEIRTETSQKYSKEIEHSASNMEFIRLSMKKSRCYSPENLINILSEGENI